jgi:hypothetical protein
MSRQLSLSHPARLQQQAAASSLQAISISLLSPSQHHHFRLKHFRIQFMDNKFKKKSNFIQFKILERYIKFENRNYIID